MSMYGVNVSIPKTLVKFLVSYEASRTQKTNSRLSEALVDVVDTPVSPSFFRRLKTAEYLRRLRRSRSL